MTRTRLLLPLLAASVLLTLAGCGSSEIQDAPNAGSSKPTAAAGSFPAEATHRFGTTVVPKRPERIVVVGLTEQDAVLALGYKPIATTEWYGETAGRDLAVGARGDGRCRADGARRL